MPDLTPTYHRDVAPILKQSCTKCHYEGGIAPFALTSYEMARAMAPALTTEVSARRMPPWGAHDTSECQPPLPWRGDERLSDEAIDIFRRWEAAGAPEGDPNDAPAEMVPTQSMELTGPAIELVPVREYQPIASLSDEFRCFVVESPVVEQGGYVTAIDVIPGNRKVVHHVTVFTDIGGVASQRAGEDGSFGCSFDDPGGMLGDPVDGVAPQIGLVLAWAPGAKPLELPPGTGIEVPAGSKIVMEVHYSSGGKDVAPDRTRLRLAMSGTRPEYAVGTWSVGNYTTQQANGDGLQPGPSDQNGVEFRVPVGARDHVETMLQTLPDFPEPLSIVGLRAHAHFTAVDIKLDLLDTEGVQRCLVQDRWDVHWQRLYTYDAPVESLPKLFGGEQLRVRCTFDNSMYNPRLASELIARGLRPSDQVYGPGALDEMCLVDLLVARKLH